MPRATHTRQAGFTVIELLAAIAILAAALIPLLTLQQSTTRAALAVERAQARLALDRAALATLRGINPAREPEGEADLGAATLAWRAEARGTPRRMLDITGNPTRFELQRFRVTAQITAPDGATRAWQVDLLGWRPLVPFEDDIF